ncbi:MAG: leucine-rich repeat protein [Clostridia bacterium]|nr:leucine-rich repeat protein [Clostridia bacterium]
MKRRLLICVLALVLVTACVFALASCGEEQYTITLNYGYDGKTQTVTVGSSFTLPTLNRSGYTFSGWKDADGKTVEGIVSVSSNTTFTAQWTEGAGSTTTVSIKFVCPDDADDVPANKTINAGDSFTLPQGPQVNGKQFVGWQSQEGATYQAGGVITSNPLVSEYVFSAVFNNTVTVAYSVTAGDTPLTAPQSVTVLEGSFVVLATAPTTDGYVFSGWEVNGATYNEGQIIAAVATANGIMAVRAKYAKLVTATFMVDGKEFTTIDVAQGGSIALPSCDNVANQVFKGWVATGSSDVLTAGTSVTVNADAVYEATFASAVGVYFYDEAGTAVVETQYIEVGASATAPAYQYAESFGGWWLTFDGFDTDLENITESVSVHPVYAYVPTQMDGLFDYVKNSNKDEYLVRFSGYASGMLATDVRDLKLPAEYNGKPVTGIYTTQTAVSTVSEANFKKGGFAISSVLERVYIPASFTQLAVFAFAKDTALTEVVFAEDSQLETINKGAFAQCTALQTITIPASVTLIDEKAFTECLSLQEVKFQEGNKPLTFGNAAFSFFGGTSISANTALLGDTGSLKTFEFPARTTKIGQYMFRYNVWMESLTFAQPNGEVIPLKIDANAFVGQNTMTSVAVPTSAYPFSKQLTSLTIPARTVEIGNCAFANQLFVETLTFEDGFNPKTLGNFTFANMISLKTINMPSSMTNIAKGMFAVGKNATTVTVGYKYYDAEHGVKTLVQAKAGEFGYNTDNLTSLVFTEGLLTVGDSAFQNRSNIATLQFANSIETIYANAFTSATIPNSNYIEISLPYNLKLISGTPFFNGWTNITKVVINCPYLETLNGAFNNTNSYVMAQKEVVFGNINSLTTINNCFTKSFLKSVTFTSEPLNPLTITDAFYDEIGLTNSIISEITLPSNIASISATSFAALKNLTSINFMDGDTNGYTFENGALYYTDATNKTLVLALYSVKDLVVADGTTIIGAKAVKGSNANATGMRQMNSVTIPSSVVVIDQYAFQCVAMDSIVIPDTVESLEDNAFYQSAIKTVVCGAKYIKNNVFNSCSQMQVLILTPHVQILSTSALGSMGNPTSLVTLQLQGNTMKTLVKGFGAFSTNPLLSNTGTDGLKILVDSEAVLNQYMADSIWAEANIFNLFTATTVTVTFGDTTVTLPAGAKLTSTQVPSDESGYVWLTSDYKEIGVGSVINASITLTKAYKVTVTNGDSTQLYYVAEGGKLPTAQGLSYFDENGKLFDASKAITKSMSLTLAQTVTVTLPNGAITVIKGAIISQDLLGNTVWCYVENGVSYVFDATAPIEEDVTLQKPVEIIIFNGTATPATIAATAYVVPGTKLSADQIKNIDKQLQKKVDNPKSGDTYTTLTLGNEFVEITADTVFQNETSYFIRKINYVTFNDEISGTKTYVWFFSGSKVTPDMVPQSAGSEWATRKTVGSNTTYTRVTFPTTSSISANTTEYFRLITTKVVAPADATASGTATTLEGNITISNVKYFQYGAKITVPELKTGYAYFDENGNKLTAESLATATYAGVITARKDSQHTVTFGDTSVKVFDGDTLTATQIPAGIWGTVEDGEFTAFDFTKPITADVTLVKYVKVTFTNGENTVDFTIPANTGLTGEQLATLPQLDEGYAWTLNNVAIDVTTANFDANANYVAKKQVTVTFGSTTVTVTEGSFTTNYIAPADGYVWVSVETGDNGSVTYTEYSQSSTYSKDTVLVAKIKVTVYAQAIATESGKAVNATIYLDAGEAIDLTDYALADGYMFTLNGEIVTDISNLTASQGADFVAMAVETYTFIGENGEVKTVTVIKG